VSAEAVERDGRPILRILVEDDGPGLPEPARAEVVKRGRRLDETKPGSGLGLSIVADLAGHYHGHLEIGVAALGGVQAQLELLGTAD
jgi:signal transduction histidine kinase